MLRQVTLTIPLVLAAAASIGLATDNPLRMSAACAADGSARGSTEVNSIQQAVQKGAEIFSHEKFGGVRTCETCHVNGGRTAGTLPNGAAVPSLAGAAAAFPKYSSRLQSVITLSRQLARCVTGGVQGKPPAFGSSEMVDLETYVTSLSKGAIMGQQFE
jgi:thiosulfate dehydrogenase